MNTTATVAKINKLLKKTTHHDKDERFMATSDLATELEAVEGVLDASLQVPVSKAILSHLEDASTDVQTVAVKCLSVLVRKLQADQIIDIVDKLGALVIDPKKAESRDIYSIGLKTIITSINDASGEAIANRLVTALVQGLKSTPSDHLVVESCLDLLRDVLSRFGSQLASQHELVLDMITPRLESRYETTRKRATNTIGVLVAVVADKPFQSLMELVIDRMDSEKHTNLTQQPHLVYTYLQTIGVISQAAGVRIGRYLNKIVPILERFCAMHAGGANTLHRAGHSSIAEENETLIELWENCLQAFESIITRCPAEVTPYLQSIVTLALDFSKWDPNYSYDDEDGDENKMETDGTEGGGGDDWGDGGGDDSWGGDAADDDNALDDDDDNSWKVRRAAVRCLSAFIRARTDILNSYYERLCDTLVSRFKERDQNVKLSIFSATCDLLNESVMSKRDGNFHTTDAAPEHKQMPPQSDLPPLLRQRSSYQVLSTRMKSLLTQANKQLSSGRPETKRAVMGVLSQLIHVRQGGLEEYLSMLVPHVTAGVKADDVRLKTDALSLLHLLVRYHSAEHLAPYIASMSNAAIEAVKDPYLKLKAEALRVCGSITNVLSRQNVDLAKELYAAVYAQLILKDMDQEVKEASLSTLAILIASFGDVLSDKINDCLPVVMQRLSNELTRLSALRAITKIASSSLQIDLTTFINPAIDELCSFLRKESQPLRHETVVTLTALVQSNGKKMKPVLFTNLLKEIAPHIGDADLHLSHLILDLISAIIVVNPAISPAEADLILQRVLAFIRSPLLQGSSLTSLVHLFQNFLSASAPALTYPALLETLLRTVDVDISLHSSMAIATCIAAMTQTSQGQTQVDATIQRFLTSITTQGVPDHQRQIALLIIGEIGRGRDLSGQKGIENVIFSAFSSDSDNVKNAASFALGNLTVGSMSTYLPLVMSLIRQHEDRRYLLCASLKEIIIRHSTNEKAQATFRPYVTQITPLLLENAESKEEGVRSMVAECLGGLAIIDPKTILPLMLSLVSSQQPHTRAMVITALRHALSASMDLVLLKENLHHFLALLKDTDLTVRRQAILTVNALAHANIELLNEVLKPTILPILYNETLPVDSLIRVVDLGPFKHKIDDGLPLRKAAYQALDTLAEVAPHRLDMQEYIRQICKGLTDHDDVQIVTYQILMKLAQFHSGSLLEVLDEVPDLIMQGVKDQLKAAKVTESPEKAERAKDVLRIAVRSMYTIHRMPGIEQCVKYCEFYQRVLKTALLAKMLQDMLQQP